MIPIALSYKIIKNPASTEASPRHLEILDLTAYQVREEAAVWEEETVPEERNVLEEELRRKLTEENERLREELLAEAALAVEDLKEAAYGEAREEGYQAGLAAAKAEGQRIRENAMNLLKEAQNRAKTYFLEESDRLLQLSVDIAEKIIRQTLDRQEEGILCLARPILQDYAKTESLIVTCHPDLLAEVQSRRGEIEKLCPQARILILEDKTLEPQGLILENEDQITDLQIKKQLQRFLELAKG